MGNRFQYYDEKTTGKHDVNNYIEIGWVEAEEMAVLYRSVTFFAFCKD